MTAPATAGSRGFASVLPGALLVVTFADDAVAGPLVAASALAWEPWGDAIAIVAFTALSLAAALTTRWALHRTTPDSSGATSRRLDKVRRSRIGRRVLGWVGDDRPLGTAVAAGALGCVAPIIIAEVGRPRSAGLRTAVICGLSYGLVFAVAYGAAGRIVSALI